MATSATTPPLLVTATTSSLTPVATQTIFVTVPTLSQPSLILTPTTALPTSIPASTPSFPSPSQPSSPSPPFLIHSGGLTHPNNEQITTIWVAAIMFFCILIGWNMFFIRSLLHPWKMLINLIHETHHVFVAVVTGANVYSINIDPDKGPISGMTGGQPLMILSAGYLGSSIVGSTLVMASFDTSASKVACLILFPLFVVCFWFGRTWARIRILGSIGLSISFWFIDEAHYLRFYILFIGVMNAFYVLWDALDDLLFRKENESDAALFARMTPLTIHAWVLIWLFVTLAFLSLGVVGGLHFFDKSAEAQRESQHSFLPT